MTKTAQDVADDLADAYRAGPTRATEVLVSYLADVIDVVHDPRVPTDGPRDGAKMRKMRLQEAAAFDRAVEGYNEVADITVDGDLLTLRRTMTGKQRSTGKTFSEAVESRFRIKDGQIAELHATSGSSSFALIHELLREGGFVDG